MISSASISMLMATVRCLRGLGEMHYIFCKASVTSLIYARTKGGNGNGITAGGSEVPVSA